VYEAWRLGRAECGATCNGWLVADPALVLGAAHLCGPSTCVGSIRYDPSPRRKPDVVGFAQGRAGLVLLEMPTARRCSPDPCLRVLAGVGAEDFAAQVFAVGDVRAGSGKRMAAAVGEGSVCVSMVHT
jgi:hypothetical protein